ncbi:MAG: LacI family DNA-binding transcriptional regulator [Lentisphaeria bacterium]|nr:LacI family DNA-binding transcriptional regulator [Lentisphaeria bacterium]
MNLKQQKKVFTLSEIAAECNVSLSTVYRILREPERADKPLRRMVRAHLIQNGYLAQYHSEDAMTVLNVIADKYQLHQSSFHFLLQKVCLEREINLVLCEEANLEKTVRSVKPCGLIYNVCPDKFHPSLPSVIIHSGYNSAMCTSVGEDDVAGISAVFAKLKELGHRRIFYFSPDLYDDDQMFQDRFIADRIKRCYILNGLDFDEELLHFCKISEETHDAVMQDVLNFFLSMKDRPTAVVTPSDVYCEAFYQRFRQLGIRIPEDVSVAGYGNIRRYKEFFKEENFPLKRVTMLNPPLTTCDMPEETVSAALDFLLEKINNPLVRNKKLLIMPQVIFTNSIGPVTKKYKPSL